MTQKPAPITPNATPIRDALQSSAPLQRLRDAIEDSNARFKAIQDALPRAVLAHVKPGPVDAEGWSLLAANVAVAAKLRQLVPRLEERLRDRGWTVCSMRIKVTQGPHG